MDYDYEDLESVDDEYSNVEHLAFKGRLAVYLTVFCACLSLISFFLYIGINAAEGLEFLLIFPFIPFGYIIWIIPVIAWVVALIHSNKTTKKVFLFTLLSIILIVFSFLTTNHIIQISPESNFWLYIVVQFLSMYAAILGWGYYLYLLYNDHSSFSGFLNILVCLTMLPALLWLCNGFGAFFEGIVVHFSLDSHVDFYMISIFIPISMVAYSVAISLRGLSNKFFILLFALGPVAAISLPYVVFAKSAKLAWQAGVSSACNGETTEYLVDENGNESKIDGGSGSSVHTSDGWYSENGDGTYSKDD